MGHRGFESYNKSMSITCKCYCNQFETQFKNWVIPKKIHTPPAEEISAVQRRGGGGSDCLKNILNLYKMSGEGEGVLLISSMGGGWIFFETTY